jgi:hypothetical protein
MRIAGRQFDFSPDVLKFKHLLDLHLLSHKAEVLSRLPGQANAI